MPVSRVSTASDRRALHLPLPRLVEIAFDGAASTVFALTDQDLYDSCGVRVAFTQRGGGASEQPYSSLNLATHVGDRLQDVEANRLRVLEAFGVKPGGNPLIVPNQVHGTEVVVVENATEAAERAKEGADAVVCAEPGVPVLLCFADCVPVIMAAPGGAFAVAHSGWRGALAGIAGKTLELLAEKAACSPGDCNIYIGPHIGPCCYEVASDLLERFERAYGPACRVDGKLDLEAAVKGSVLASGANAERIAGAQACTSCTTDKYYSYRAEGGTCGRHGAFVYKEM